MRERGAAEAVGAIGTSGAAVVTGEAAVCHWVGEEAVGASGRAERTDGISVGRALGTAVVVAGGAVAVAAVSVDGVVVVALFDASHDAIPANCDTDVVRENETQFACLADRVGQGTA